MRRHTSVFIFWLLLLAPMTFSANRTPYQLEMIVSTEREMICDVVFDTIQATQRQVNSLWQTRVALPGCSYTAREGWPHLPVTSLVLGIPFQGTPRVQIVEEQMMTKSLSAIELVSYPEAWREYLTAAEHNDLSINAAETWYPVENVRIGLCGMMREQRIMQIELHPVRYSLSQSLLQWTSRLRLRIVFDGSASAQTAMSAAPANQADGFESSYAEYVANYEQSRKWRKSSLSTLSKTSLQDESGQARIRINVNRDGVYRITGQELADIGVDLSTVDPATLCLTSHGRDVPVLLEDQGDGHFNEQDRFIFIGEHNRGANTYRSWYSDTNVYWLSWGVRVGSRMARFSGATDGASSDTVKTAAMQMHLENDVIYARQLAYMEENSDHWFWCELKNKEKYSIPLSIPEPLKDGKFRIQAEMQGLTYLTASPDHKALISLNQQELGTSIWDNQEFVLFDSGWQEAAPLTSNNSLSFYLTGDLPNVVYDRVMLNWVNFQFSGYLRAVNDSLRFTLKPQKRKPVLVKNFSNDHIYAFSDQGQQIVPDKIYYQDGLYHVLFAYETQSEQSLYLTTESRFLTVNHIEQDTGSDLLNGNNAADYIIITHHDFMQQAQRLAQFRATQNMRTMVVDVQDVYDQFNDGIYDPNAIQAFLRYAYEHYQKPAPLYVLLIGDTSHYMDKNGKFKSYIPTMMTYTGSWGMTSSDNAFVTVSGDDILPDLYIGRFPVNSGAEADILVSKTIDYESTYSMGDWRRNIVLVSGNDDQFGADANELFADYVPRHISASRLATMSNSPFFGSTEDLASRWNNGQVLINFVGHGGGQVFEDNGLFLLEDVGRLTNKDKYTVMFSLTCFIGYFDNPDKPSLSEELLRKADAGIVSHFGSAGRASMPGDHYLDKVLFNLIFKQGRRRIGEITTLAKYGLIEMTNGYWDTIRHFNLLGDPASQMAFVANQATVQLNKTDFVTGDVVRATVACPVLPTGQALITLHNDIDSLLVSKTVTLTQGQAAVDLLTLTPELAKTWTNGTGIGSVKVYVQNGRADGCGGVAFTLNQQTSLQVNLSPSAPRHNQPFYFVAQIDAQAISKIGGVKKAEIRWSINQATWSFLPVLQDLTGQWKTVTPLVSSEGTRIYFKLVLTGPTGQELTSELKDVTIASRPDLYTDVNAMTVSGVTQTYLSALLKNNGGISAGPFTVAFYEGADQNSYTPIGSSLTVQNLAAKTDTTITILWPGSVSGQRKVWVKVDGEGKIDETNESNNISVVNLRIAGPALGTNGPVYSNEANVYINIPAAAMPKFNLLNMSRSWDATFNDVCTLSSLTPLRVRDLPGAFAFSCTFNDTAITLSKEMTVAIYYDRDNAVNQQFLKNNGVRIYTWNAASAAWTALTTTIDTYQGLASAKLPVFSKYFALLGSADKSGPTIDVGVVGQNFALGDIVGKKPVFTFFLQDSTGFDVNAVPVTVYLNQQPVADEQMRIAQSPDARQSLSMTFSPDLSAGNHVITVEAKDVNGNSSSLEIPFRVLGQFDVAFVANHPNPFSRETTIAFELEDTASEVALSIFTVSGRLIRNQKFYGVTGYVEWEWDSRDDEGNEIANGVYYLKFVARNGDKKIERIEKLAKLE